MNPTLQSGLNLLLVVLGGLMPLLSTPGLNPAYAQIAGALVQILGVLLHGQHTARQAVAAVNLANPPNLASPANPLAPSIEVKP